MVNYKGPKKNWTAAELRELESRPHSYGKDPQTGHEIIEELPQPRRNITSTNNRGPTATQLRKLLLGH